MKMKNKKVFSKNDFFNENFGREEKYRKLDMIGGVLVDKIIVRISLM